MSCETNANKVSNALRSGGVTRTAAKTAYARATSMRRLAAAGLVVGVASAVAMHPSQTKRAGQEIAGAAKAVGRKYVDTAQQNMATAQKAADTVKDTAKKAGETMRDLNDRQQDKLAAVAHKAAPVTGRILTTATTIERSGLPRSALAVGAVALNVPLSKINRMTVLAGKTTAALVNPAADLSRQSLAGSVVQKRRVLFFFNKKTTVQVWNSSAGKLLNRPDRLVSGKNILAEKSAMLKINGTSWHRGTVTFRAPDGQKRTLTHLQSLNLPAQHYYFNRPLSDKETAGLLTHQPGFRADRMDGYLGQVSPAESLSPGWAETKHRLIKTAALNPAASPPRRDTTRVTFRDVKDAASTAKNTVRAAKSIFTGEK